MVSRVQRGTQKLSLNNSEQQHDPYFIHVVRQSIADYFSSIIYRKFTDGCAAQYNIDIALGISVTLVMTLVLRISPELFLRLHLLKIIFYLRVQLSNTCIICTVFNMYVKIFNYKSQNWAWPSTFFKMYVKGTYLNEIG